MFYYLKKQFWLCSSVAASGSTGRRPGGSEAFSPAHFYADVAQWQSKRFISVGSQVQFLPSALKKWAGK